MTDPSYQEHLLLLSDAIDRTIANPTASECWLNLIALIKGVSEQEILKQALDLLRLHIPSVGIPGFFRALHFNIATGEARHIAEAGRILLSIQPENVDRMAAFHSFCWQSALIAARNRDEFVQALRQGCLPQISHLIGQAIAKHRSESFRPRSVIDVKKVAVVAPYLISQAHPPTVMATDQATVLLQNGMEVNLFSCQEAVGPNFLELLGNGVNTLPEAVDLGNWLKSLNFKVKIQIGDSRFSLMRRAIDMLKSIAEFDPDMIVFVGLHSCLARSLYDVRPVLSLGINSVPPMAPSDVWLTAQEEMGNRVAANWGADYAESLAWYHPYRVRRKLHDVSFTRADLNIPERSVVLISVGNILHQKITGAWAEQMSAILADTPGLIWLLVGGNAEMPEVLKGAPQGQLRLMPYSAGISAIIACSDIYINPPNMGGGFSVAEAMAEGLPVLAYAGSDGGDKVGGEAIRNDAEFFAKLDAMIKNIALRIETGKRMRERFDSSIDLANAGFSLMSACNAAVARYQQRIGAQ